jgi:hypothetical protein
MIDRTSRELASAHHAELTGIVPQLTTSSRNHGELVDLWFGVQWNERSEEWEQAFSTIVEGRRPDPLTPSFFALFAHASTDGLIVARHVRRDAAAWRQAEEEARLLITDVNAEVAAERTPPPPPPTRRRGWSLRVQSVSAYLASMRWLGEPKPGFRGTDLPIQVRGNASQPSR